LDKQTSLNNLEYRIKSRFSWPINEDPALIHIDNRANNATDRALNQIRPQYIDKMTLVIVTELSFRPISNNTGHFPGQNRLASLSGVTQT
jgi:hypothetical protein